MTLFILVCAGLVLVSGAFYLFLRGMPDAGVYFARPDDALLDLPTVYREDLFRGRTVLVSGGGSGIGKAIACLFGRLGARLVRDILDRGADTGGFLEQGLRTLWRLFADGMSSSELEVKPLGGMGGTSIFRIQAGDPNPVKNTASVTCSLTFLDVELRLGFAVDQLG
mgnify:CR=1 FL=1